MRTSRVFSLMYHDVCNTPGESGFPGGWADLYKIAPSVFADHLQAIADMGAAAGGLVTAPWASRPVFITFDDGGSGSLEAAELLERHGWRGHFFVPTDFIGRPGFLTESQVQALHRRGHSIGSHGASHRARMSACSRGELDDEWQRSARVLGEMLGGRVLTASVPGGYYARRVAESAAGAGIRFLFTSEPTSRVQEIDGCTVLGRYYVQRGTPPDAAASFAGGARWPRLRQGGEWQVRKVAKTALGPLYLRLAAALHER